jgi:hypothetical protein
MPANLTRRGPEVICDPILSGSLYSCDPMRNTLNLVASNSFLTVSKNGSVRDHLVNWAISIGVGSEILERSTELEFTCTTPAMTESNVARGFSTCSVQPDVIERRSTQVKHSCRQWCCRFPASKIVQAVLQPVYQYREVPCCASVSQLAANRYRGCEDTSGFRGQFPSQTNDNGWVSAN